MTQESAGDQPSPPEVRRRPFAVAWRIGAVALVVLLMVAAAHLLRNPAGEGGSKGSAEVWPPPTAGEGPAGLVRKDGATQDPPGSLRKLMAGLMKAATEEDGDYRDPKNQTPEARRKFIADQLGVSPDYPQDAIPADLAPKDAEVLIVIESPGAADARMVLVRVRKDVQAAMAEFQKLYVTSGWASEGPPDPKAQPDQGWLMRFTKGNQERIVYARPRHVANESLVAIYDSRY